MRFSSLDQILVSGDGGQPPPIQSEIWLLQRNFANNPIWRPKMRYAKQQQPQQCIMYHYVPMWLAIHCHSTTNGDSKDMIFHCKFVDWSQGQILVVSLDIKS